MKLIIKSDTHEILNQYFNPKCAGYVYILTVISVTMCASVHWKIGEAWKWFMDNKPVIHKTIIETLTQFYINETALT
jgi:hypothetical protein